MKKDFVYLTYYQIMAFMDKIEQMRKQNQYFNDDFASMFEDYAINRAFQISYIPEIIKKIIPNASKFKISIDLFNYLEKVTSIDVYDKKLMREFTKDRVEKDKTLLNTFFNGDYKRKSYK